MAAVSQTCLKAAHKFEFFDTCEIYAKYHKYHFKQQVIKNSQNTFFSKLVNDNGVINMANHN